MKLRVLYLDDEEDLCSIFSEFFSSSEIEVKTFTDPKKALEAIEKDPPHLAFFDYQLPGTTGDDVALAVKAKIPLFLISGNISITPKYPFQKVFGKPYQDTELLAEMQRIQKLL